MHVHTDRDLCDALAALLAYPGPGYRVGGAVAAQFLAAAPAEVREAVQAHLRQVAEIPDAELEELYTRTFDLNPVAALDVGWHLYGEAYERGAFLAEARDLLRRTGVADGPELPDHLTLLLPVLARLPEDEAAALGHRILPAIEKMRAALSAKASPYESLLAAVEAVTRGAAGREGAPQ